MSVSLIGSSRVQALVAEFDHRHIVIVGDVMLDEFLVGRVERISPEAPVPVVLYEGEEQRVGGAANVAHNVTSLGGRPTLVGLVGDDEAGARLVAALGEKGIDGRGLVVDPGRRTTRKLRIVTSRNQQVARIDYEDDREADGGIEDEVVRRAEGLVEGASVIVVSDYLKGAITRNLMARVVAAAGARGVPVLVDPKIPHIDYYGGATLVTPNHHEAEVATHLRIRTETEAGEAARVFQQRARCENVLITRGEHGMCLFDGTRHTHLPAVAREVSDVTGAGDTVIATLALSLAAGATLCEAATLANHAAGVVVGKFGAATVTKSELLEAFFG
ncbi:MAG: D-glycero-beta-D-manno-heptose-7-phosphate kinase [Vicinamibacterales bacterium]